MTAPLADERPGYKLMRVADEVLDKLEREGSEPVHVVGAQRNEDGTIDLILRTPERSPADERLREARDRWRERARDLEAQLHRANDELVQIADYSPSEVADAIDSTRAAIKDALAAGVSAEASPDDGWTPTSDNPSPVEWECELCGGRLDGPGEKCGSAQHGPAGSIIFGRAVPVGGPIPDAEFGVDTPPPNPYPEGNEHCVRYRAVMTHSDGQTVPEHLDDPRDVERYREWADKTGNTYFIERRTVTVGPWVEYPHARDTNEPKDGHDG